MPITRPVVRLEILPVLGAVLAAGAFALALVLPSAAAAIDAVPREWAQVFARTHPLIVHFPIAFFVLAPLFDLLFRKKEGECGDAAYWTLALGAFLGVVASAAGWLHGALEPHSDAVADVLDTHRWVSLAATAAALLGAIGAYVHRTSFSRLGLSTWRCGLVLSLLLAMIGGHLGGTLVYGEGHVLEPVRDAWDARARKAAANGGEVAAGSRASDPVTFAPTGDHGPPIDFAAEIRPLLDRRCVECHCATKKKGLLRFDKWTERIAGIKKAVIVPGRPEESEFITRICLPPDDPDFMPEDGEPLPLAEIELLKRWIAQGAPWPRDEGATAEPETDGDSDESGDRGR